jgi:hypothetical protein
MPERVITKDEISLNAVYYPIRGPVRSTLASTYPAKVTIGDTNKDSLQRASVVAWNDFRGGIGKWRMDGATDVDRIWYGVGRLRHKGHLVLPPLATQTAASGASGAFDVGGIGDLLDEVYGAFGTDVRKYNNVTDSWGVSLATLPSGVTDTGTFDVGGTVYLVFAHKTGYTYTPDGEAWTDDTEDVQFMTFWDDRLWGIDKTGQLRWSNVIGTWVDDAKLRLPDDSVTDLFIGRDPSGEEIIYAMTTMGLFSHDAANERFVQTELELPTHPDNGKGSSRWRDALYITAGLQVFKWVNGTNSAVLTVVGPDRDDGLPSSKRGSIRKLLGTNNDLLALVDATSGGTLSLRDTFFGSAMGSQITGVLPPNVGTSAVLAFNEVGWDVLWESTTDTKAVTAGVVSNAYNKYRLWWAQDERVYWMTLPRDIVNPNEIADFTYGASTTYDLPWFDAGQAEVDKLAKRFKVEVKDTSSNETVTVSYALNYGTSFTALTAITSDGTTTFDLPNSTTPEGVAFRAIQIRIVLARGSTTTNSPDVLSVTLEWRKKPAAQWGHTFEVDITKPYKGKTPLQLRSNLLAVIEQNLNSQFTFRDDDGDTRNFYVDVVSASGLEQTGHDERGSTQVLVVEI